jgi:Fur family ferric uptake transcriptional regulator
MPWANDILKKHGLKQTENRLKTLEILHHRNSAISHNDLEQELGKGTDRVTLYRILNAFEEKGIIHGIFGQKGGTQYALCHHCTEHNHTDNHLHFNCSKCQKTFCVDNIALPNIKLPSGFVLNEINLNATGLCKNCNY